MRIAPITPPYSTEVQAQFDQLPPSWQPPFEHFKILARDPRRVFRTGNPPTAFAGRPLSDKCICVGWPAGAGRSEGQAAVSRGVSERFKPC